MKIVKFSKVYYGSSWAPYVLECSSKTFETKKELINFYQLKNIKVCGNTFYINTKGTQHDIKIYSGEIEDDIAQKFQLNISN
jgi:hypothetical protein